MKNIILSIILFSPLIAFGQNMEIGIQGSLWWTKVNQNGLVAGQNGTLAISQENGIYQYPYNHIGVSNFRMDTGSDFVLDNPGIRIFVRKHFGNYYLGLGIQYNVESFGLNMPYQSTDGNENEQLYSTRSRLIELPVTFGHRFEFAPFLRVFWGIQVSRAFTTSANRVYFYSSNPMDFEIYEMPMKELGSVFINNYKDFYVSALAGLGIDYRFVTVDFQLERSVSSLTASKLEFNSNPGRFDLRKTRKIIWIGFRIPLNR